MAIKVSKKLSLVLEVEREGEPSFFVHSEPVGAEIYDANYRVLSKVISSMYEDGLRPLVQSRIAHKALRDLMADMDPESARYKSAQALIAEITRLTNVIMPTPNGYQPMPLAVAQKEMDPTDYDEVLNYITFFTAISWVHTKQELKDSLYPIVIVSGAQVTSSNVTEFAKSLKMSTPDANTGEKAIQSSIAH